MYLYIYKVDTMDTKIDKYMKLLKNFCVQPKKQTWTHGHRINGLVISAKTADYQFMDNKAFKKYVGRPEVISSELIEKIYKILLSGAYIETAAVYCGVNKKTLYEWMKKGDKEPDSIYGKFCNAVEKALAESEIRDLTNIDRAAMGQDWEYEREPDNAVDENGRSIAGQLKLNGKGNPIPKKIGQGSDWAASAWRLERKHPKKWARTEKLEHSGKDGGPQVIVTLPSNGYEVRDLLVSPPEQIESSQEEDDEPAED